MHNIAFFKYKRVSMWKCNHLGLGVRLQCYEGHKASGDRLYTKKAQPKDEIMWLKELLVQ